jgi:LysM repeat protein
MKTPWLVGTIVLVHCIAVGTVLLTPGCGTTRPVSRGPSEQEEVILPPREVAEEEQKPDGGEPGREPSDVKSWPGETSMYVVAKGDSLSEIASRFDVRMKKLMALNGIKDPDLIKVGQTLVVPGDADSAAGEPEPEEETGEPSVSAADGGQYEVKKGDTLSEIAVEFGSSVKEIKRANNLESDVIRVGQKLLIPGSGAPEEREQEPEQDTEEEQERRVRAVDLAPAAEEPEPVADPEPREADEPGEDSEPESTARVHIVEAGEDLKTIAMLWGVSVKEIRELNDLGSAAEIEPGDRLKIPVLQY